MTDAPPPLPHDLLVAWGLLEQTRRGPKPGLSIAAIMVSGIELADEQGLAAVSMASIAKKLGFTTMSLYRYVESKDELLRLMADAAIDLPPMPDPAEGWRTGLTAWTHAVLAYYAQHPWVMELPITGAPLMPRNLGAMDRGLAALQDLPLTPEEKLSTILLLSGYARNEALVATQLVQARSQAGITVEQAGQQYATAIATLVTPDRFPALARFIQTGVFTEPAGDTDFSPEMVEYGLQRILDGIEAYVSRRT